MAKYLKSFATHSQYNAYITGNDKVLPNVSLCDDQNDVHYNPIETRLVCKYNVTSTSSSTNIISYSASSASSLFSEMEVDGVVQTLNKDYTFPSTGEHTVKYTLVDPTNIGNYAFASCNNLTSVSIPSGVTTIGNDVFYTCRGLTSVIIPDSVTSIGREAFQHCNSLTSVTIGGGVTSIGDYAFGGCSGLTSIAIPNSVTSIGYYAFRECTTLASLTIGSGVTTINNDTFYGCTGLTSITIDNNTIYDSRNNCNAIIETSTNTLIKGCKNTTIPNTVTSIGDSAFYDCTSLTSVTIPNSVTSIGTYAFRGCSGLTSLTFPNSVTAIGNNAFYNCSGLTTVTIGNGMSSIGYQSFYNCSNLNSITCLCSTAPSIQSYTFRNVKTNGTLYVPTGSTGYDTWMGTGNYYLGKYSWTKVEQ